MINDYRLSTRFKFGPATGAGARVQQRVIEATGLRAPKLIEVLSVRYVWAGVDEFRGADLGGTPRVEGAQSDDWREGRS